MYYMFYAHTCMLCMYVCMYLCTEVCFNYHSMVVSGQRSGHGRCEYASGGCYEGDYHLNRKDGRGVMLSADGSRYEGQFKDGKKCKKLAYLFSFSLLLYVCMYVCVCIYSI